MEVIEYSTMVNIAKAVKAHVNSLEVSRANLIEMDKLIQRVTNGKLHQQTAANVLALYCYHVAKRLREVDERFPELISFEDRFDRTLYMFKPDPNVDFAFLLRGKEEKMRVFDKWYYPRMVVLDSIITGSAKCLMDDVRADWYTHYDKESGLCFERKDEAKVREAAEQLNAQYKGIVNFKELERTMQEFAEEKRFLFTTTYKVEEIKSRDVLKSEMESLLNSYNVLKSETEKLLNSENGGDVTSAADDVHLDVEFEDEARPRWNSLHLKHVREVINHSRITPKVCQELTYVWEESTAKHVIPMLNALGFKVEGKAKSTPLSRKYIVTWEVSE